MIKKTVQYMKQNGVRKTIKKIILKIKSHGIVPTIVAANNAVSSKDVIGFCSYIVDKTEIPFSIEDYKKAGTTQIILNWIIPEMGVGSGGHINIFRFVEMLEERGIHNRIYVDQPIYMHKDEELRAFLRANYRINPDKIEIYSGIKNIQFAHGTVATGWQTAYFVKRFQNTISKFYFVQDFEPYFYAHGSEYSFAENTYDFGFYGITAGEWLKEKLNREYGMRTESYSFSYDRKLYTAGVKRDSVSRIFFYARPVTPRRSFELGLLALTELWKRKPNIEVIFAGWDVSNYVIPFVHLNAGCVALNELSDLYAQCDMCLVLSNTNLSLLPLEIMASNSVVVSNKGGNNEWLLNGNNAILVENDPVAIAEQLEYYLEHKEELAIIRKNGLHFAEDTNWISEGNKVYHTIVNFIEESNERIQKTIIKDC